ncbi:efflux RND transporter periplasmic adaptor subunit [Colwellia sp. MB02u-18]|uniref:efflux RND transporter periplasmic adaptor subunit n=1 Tax=unclassified Colwellia TaxID=196834 RepID=UPI0015F666D9|nr:MULTISPECIES: efflux RND transporter periplasmic adaptor subunit [unclassified Colwellia]MBA6222911.1 efflux RND transporter periplasmic adaptor subunit [Colwellia sp. MB3u-45]MBA6267743.1 efflux RND transporter periplasmic adaptor subunit [Colwellia sp. MB3u-43]MBA6322343.1 efflux RND transporter periplasmic adaptor subunit [Colwellia sp. MB02u-19]MBA6324342.1 efflux RND transporter periplasmic adaptor subunit [Colwellia sp. MB02u-18]MBA6332498.1 efflux RND transporter periplasmic adaptor 
MMNSALENNHKKNQRMIPLRFVVAPIAIILVAVIGLIIFTVLSPKPAKKPVIIKAPLVEVKKIARQDVGFVIASQGSVLPSTQTQLISEVSGQITFVNEKFNIGGFFTQGEVLLSIDDINYQVALLQAQSQLDAAKALLIEEQAKKDQAEEQWLLTKRALSEAPVLALRLPQLQKAKADIKAAKANVIGAEVKLARTKIIIPYDAIVKEKQVDIGQYVSMGSALTTIFAVDYAEVRLPIKPRDVGFLNLPKINAQQSSRSTVDIYTKVNGTEHRWASNLTRYEGEVDSRSRVHYVIAQIDDPYSVLSSSKHQELRIGSFVNAKISGKEVKDIVTIPRDALHGANRVYLVDKDNKLHIQEINILRNDATYVYSHDSFGAGFRLVTTQMQAPVEGMALRVLGELKDTPKASSEDSIVDEQGDDE